MPVTDTARQGLVLIVEDEPLMRMMAIDVVEEAGLRALQAADADQAMAILESRPDIGIVFTDIDMPGSMDGMELAVRVRDRWPPIELLITSGHRKVAADQLPARGIFMSRPYRRADVVSTLRRMSGRPLP